MTAFVNGLIWLNSQRNTMFVLRKYPFFVNACAEFILWHMKIYLHFLSFLNTDITEKTQVSEILFAADKDWFPLHRCWWPCVTTSSSQGISSNDVDLDIPEYSGLRTTRIQGLVLCFYKPSPFLLQGWRICWHRTGPHTPSRRHTHTTQECPERLVIWQYRARYWSYDLYAHTEKETRLHRGTTKS